MTSLTSTEDDLIKKRLLIEGDSGNDDRLINKLIKNFVKWTNSFYYLNDKNDANGINDDVNSSFLNEQILAALAHIEFGLVRNQFIYDMNSTEQEHYEILYKKIDCEIEKAKKKIVENKLELQEARKIRKNRQEYDVLARQILNYPDRVEMQQTIKSLEAKLENLKKSEHDLDKKIDLRRKQFSVVLQCLSSLKNLIETDTNLDQFINSQTMSSQSDDQPMLTDAVAQKPNPAETNGLDKKPTVEDADENDERVQRRSQVKTEKHETTIEVDMEES